MRAEIIIGTLASILHLIGINMDWIEQRRNHFLVNKNIWMPTQKRLPK
jgi:hypothetical protein